MILLVIYVFGFFLTWSLVWSSIIDEFDSIDNFWDFATAIYLVACMSAVWPIVAPLYGFWTMYKKTKAIK